MKWSRKDIPTIEVLKACDSFHSGDNKNGLEILREKFKCPEKIAFAAIERDLGKGLLNYGVSIRTAWVTDKGKEVIKEKENEQRKR